MKPMVLILWKLLFLNEWESEAKSSSPNLEVTAEGIGTVAANKT